MRTSLESGIEALTPEEIEARIAELQGKEDLTEEEQAELNELEERLKKVTGTEK